MYANHPAIAKRWESVTPKDRALPKHEKANSSESNETWKKGEQKQARLPGPKRDFKSLSPSQFKRFPGQSSEKEAQEEWGTEAHLPEAHNGPQKMKLKGKNVLDPLAKRDVKLASRRN
jgi:hypothetical protein